MALLLNVPTDVLLRLVSYLDVQDAISWSMVCVTLHALRHIPSFWMSSLKATLDTRPLACPTHEDLVPHNLRSLQDIGMHTMRVQRSWNSPRPQCIDSGSASMDLGVDAFFLFCVPGTWLCVTHSKNRRELTCWHYGKRQALSSLPSGRIIWDLSQAQTEGPGKFSVALLTTGLAEDRGYNICIVCVDYSPTCGAGALSYTFEHRLSKTPPYRGLFMTPKTVGVIQSNSIFALNRTSHASTAVETDLASEDHLLYPRVATDRERIFILGENNKRSHLFTCPPDLLSDECVASNGAGSIKGEEYLRVHLWPSQIITDKICMRGVCSTNSSYGVSAVSVYSYAGHTLARWWVTDPNEDSLAATDLVFIPGFSPYGSERFQASYFGLYLLVITQSLARNNPPLLWLVRFDPATRTSSVLQPSVPASVDLNKVFGVALDEHRGVMFLMEELNVLHIIPFA